MNVPEPRKLPSGTWFIQLRLNGVSVPVSADSKKECIRQAELIKAEHRAEKRVIQKRTGITLKAACEKYIDSRTSTLSPSTIRDYRSIVKNRFQPVMNSKVSDIKDWQSVCNCEAGKKSAKTVVNAYRFIVSVLMYNGFVPQKVTLPQIPKHERPWLEPEQIPLFIAAVHGTPCEIAALMALHSLRRSEICAVKWEGIDLENGTITVKGAVVPNENHKFVEKQTNKNRSSARIVPIMIPELRAALEEVGDKTGNVVNVLPDVIGHRINRICKKNNLPCVGAHGLRHSFASLAYHLGMPEKEVMEIGGWSDTRTMHNIYTHLAESDRAKSINKMSKFYKNANEIANRK